MPSRHTFVISAADAVMQCVHVWMCVRVCVRVQLLSMMAMSSEFEQMAVREEELQELDTLARDACHFDIKGGPENKHGKVNILLQVSHPHTPCDQVFTVTSPSRGYRRKPCILNAVPCIYILILKPCVSPSGALLPAHLGVSLPISTGTKPGRHEFLFAVELL